MPEVAQLVNSRAETQTISNICGLIKLICDKHLYEFLLSAGELYYLCLPTL